MTYSIHGESYHDQRLNQGFRELIITHSLVTWDYPTRAEELRYFDFLSPVPKSTVHGHQLPQRSALMETIVKRRTRWKTNDVYQLLWAVLPPPLQPRWGLSFGFNQWACSMPRPCTDSHLFIGNLITWAILNSVEEGMRVMSLLPWVTVSAREARQREIVTND